MAGGAGPFDGDDEPQMIVGINVTPLVDIALVLLLIFMVAATFIASAGIRLDLPKATSGTAHDERPVLTLTLTKEGQLFLNGQKSDDGAVAAFIKEELPKVPDLQAVIAADRSVPHGDVVHLIDMVKRAGVRRFAINVDPGGAATSGGRGTK